jgi:hypothetical protein
MRGGRLFLAAAWATMLAGCSMVAPYPTQPGEAKKGEPEHERVAVCYDRLASSPADVQKSAQEQCESNTRATLVDTDYHLDYCPLLLPARATFACVPQKK